VLELLRGDDGQALAGGGCAWIRERVSLDAPSLAIGRAAGAAQADRVLRELDVSDLFHDRVPLDYIERVFGVVRRAISTRFRS